MSRLKEFRARNAELLASLSDLKRRRSAGGEAALASNRAMTENERTEFVALGTQLTKLEAEFAGNARQLAEAERQNEEERSWRPGDGSVDPDLAAGQRAAAAAGIVPAGGFGGVAGLPRAAGRLFAQMFPTLAGSLDGWGSGAEYLGVIARGLHDSRLRADTQTGEVGAAGGFAVPTQLWGSILDLALETEIVRPRAQPFAMTAAEMDVAAFDDLDHTGGSVAGLTLQFIGEAGTLTPQIAKLRALRLRARKGALFCEASNELLADAPNFERTLTAALAKALSFGMDQRFLFGDGAASPQGALVSGAAIVVARTSAGKVLYDDILQMYSRLTPASVGRAVWLAHSSLVPQLGTLSIPVGTGGSAIQAMTTVAGKWMLMQHEVVFTEKMKALGVQGDLALCDFSQYAVGLRKQAALDKSADVGFARDVTTFRLIARLDGQPLISSPIQPLTGDPVSPFIVLGDAE